MRGWLSAVPMVLAAWSLAGCEGGGEKPHQPKAARPDAEAIQGTWEVVSAEEDGKPSRQLVGCHVVLDGETITLEGKHRPTRISKYRLDPDKRPIPQIDIAGRSGGWDSGVDKGIYQLEGDRLKMCFSGANREARPLGFSTRAGDGRGLVVLRRIGPVMLVPRRTPIPPDDFADVGRHGSAQPPSLEALKEMVSRAASISVEDFQAIAEAADLMDLRDHPDLPLTLLIVSRLRGKPRGGTERDFRLLGPAGLARMADVAEAICPIRPADQRVTSRPIPDAYASVIRPEYITECTRAVRGDTVTGKVSFRVDGVYEGAVEYVAGRGPSGWRIEEFRLPNSGERTVLTVRGTWVATSRGLGDTAGDTMATTLPAMPRLPRPMSADEDTLVIRLDRHGAVHLAGHAVTSVRLREALARVGKADPGRRIRIDCDGDMPFKHFIQVMEACLQVGLRNVSCRRVAWPARGQSGRGLPAIPPGQKRIQGDWLVVSGVFEGIPSPPGMLRKAKVTYVFGKDTFEMREGKPPRTTAKWRYRIDASRNPRAIDFLDAEKKEVNSVGIYKVEGDTLWLCFAVGKDEKSRPTEFRAKIKEPLTYVVARRIRP